MQDVEDEVRFVLMCAIHSCVAGHVVGDKRVRANAFFQPEVFTGMPGVNCVDLPFNALAVDEERVQGRPSLRRRRRQTTAVWP